MMKFKEYFSIKYNQLMLSKNNALVYSITALIVLLMFFAEATFVWGIGYILVHLLAQMPYIFWWQAYPLTLFAKVVFYNCKSKHDSRVNR